jgi:hypothetical protein
VPALLLRGAPLDIQSEMGLVIRADDLGGAKSS